MNELDVDGQRACGWISRERAQAWVLLLATGIVAYLCYRLIRPFLGSLAWAFGLAVIAGPWYRWISKWIPYPNLAAAVSTFAVGLLIALPTLFVGQHLAREATRATIDFQEEISNGHWRSVFEKYPHLEPVERWIDSQWGLTAADRADNVAVDESTTDVPGPPAPTNRPDPKAAGEQAATALTHGLGTLVTGTASLGMQFFVTFMTLFFFFRDRRHALAALKALMPLSSSETAEVFSRIDDTIHATVYGSVVVALVQGTMGGFMFWCLGLPSPLLWGAIMALLAVVPVLGTFVIWAPTAIYLTVQGHWAKALILASWGAIAIGLIDNLLYPFLVGSRIRFHTLLVFFAIVGGLALFGMSGVILGPLLLTIADALLDIWRRRTFGHVESEFADEAKT